MSTYKTIAELNNCQEVCCCVHYPHVILETNLKTSDGSFVTQEYFQMVPLSHMVKGAYYESQRYYRGCPSKNCFVGVREKDD